MFNSPEEMDSSIENPSPSGVNFSFENPNLQSSSASTGANSEECTDIVEMDTIPAQGGSSHAAVDPETGSQMFELDLHASHGGSGKPCEEPVGDQRLFASAAEEVPGADGSEGVQRGVVIEADGTDGSGNGKSGSESTMEKTGREKSRLETDFQLIRRALFALYLLCFLFYYLPFLLF